MNRAIIAGSVIVGIAVMLSISMMPADAPGQEIDIKPGSDPNSINIRSMGLVPVAILGSDTFDVNDVDVTTLKFRDPDGTGPKHDGHLEDVNDDGFTDLVTHYVQKFTGIEVGDDMACISGQTLDGAPIFGCDSIVTIPSE